MTRSIVLVAATVSLAVAGCVSLGPKPAKTLLTLTPAAMIAAGPSRTAPAGGTIVVLNPTTPAAIATTRIAVYDGPGALSYVKEAAWNDAPARLFAQVLGETIGQRTGKIVVGLRQASLTSSEQLSGQLQRFGIDAATMQAVVLYDGLRTGEGGRVETRRFEARVPVSAVEAVESGRALNQAANDVAVQVADWVKG